MNKTQKIILIAILAVIAIVLVFLVINKNTKKSNISASSADDLVKIVEKLYEGKDLPKLNTSSIDVSNKDMVNSATGLKDGSDLEYLVLSEPLMSSQAYSLVIAKVKDGKADSIAKQMSENVDMRKWICVSAEKLYATSSGDFAILVMSSEEWAKPVYDAFKKEAGTIGKEYKKDEENFDFGGFEDMGFPVETDDGSFEYEPTEVVQ